MSFLFGALAASCSSTNSSDGAADAGKTDAGAADAGAPIDDAATVDSESGSDAAAVACNAVPVTECPAPAPRYADVAPIIAERCVACHDGKMKPGPWPLIDYNHVADWADVVRADLLTCAMPPPDAPPMPDGERQLLLTWLRCGAPE